MKSLRKFISVAAAVAFLSAGSAAADSHADRAKIEAVLSSYEQALNASDTDAVLSPYAADGVFMPQHGQPNVGAAAIRAAYRGVFSAITLRIKFTVDEILQVAPNWAFARTRSEGTVTIKENGATVPEGNQELFVLQKQDDGAWKIARYIFSTTNPRH